MWCISGHNLMTRVIRLHFKPIYTPFLPHVLQLHCNNLPHENYNNLPQGGNFTRSTCQSNTHAHKAVMIPSILQVYFIFLPLSISDVVGYFLAQGSEFSKITRRGKISFLAITFSYCRIWSPKFACRVIWYQMFFLYDITENSPLSSSFWENATVTTCPCNN